MKDKWVRRALAFTIPATFVLILVGAGVRDRVLDPVVSGGLIAILGTVVALFAGGSSDDSTGGDLDEYGDYEGDR